MFGRMLVRIKRMLRRLTGRMFGRMRRKLFRKGFGRRLGGMHRRMIGNTFCEKGIAKTRAHQYRKRPLRVPCGTLVGYLSESALKNVQNSALKNAGETHWKDVRENTQEDATKKAREKAWENARENVWKNGLEKRHRKNQRKLGDPVPFRDRFGVSFGTKLPPTRCKTKEGVAPVPATKLH
jgi:hypothetical protein